MDPKRQNNLNQIKKSSNSIETSQSEHPSSTTVTSINTGLNASNHDETLVIFFVNILTYED